MGAANPRISRRLFLMFETQLLRSLLHDSIPLAHKPGRCATEKFDAATVLFFEAELPSTAKDKWTSPTS
jgi:hypothetical protein